MAIQFNGKVFTFTQPDGSRIKLRGFGDQYHAVFETLDGFTVTQDPATGFYEVAQLSADGNRLLPAAGTGNRMDGVAAGLPRGLRASRESAAAAARASALLNSGRRCEQRRQERRMRMRVMRELAAAGGPLLAPPQRDTVGIFVGLCLLIDFSDSPATISRDEVERFCNEPGYSGFGNNGSVFDFYNENSIGRCRYTNIVAPYYRAQQPKTYYTDPRIRQPQRAIELILEALAHHQDNGFDFSLLTADNEGFVFASNVYYAGPVTNNWAEGLWPHSHHLGNPVRLAPGRSVYDYQFTAMGDELELGTFCHENGHMLCDYPDLYDYGYESSGVGGFCLMCAGNNVSEKNPIPISAYLKRTSSNLTIDQISPVGPTMTFRCLLTDIVTPPRTLNLISTPNRSIPDNDPTGITDTLNFADAVTISGLKVGLEITHTYRGDLRVKLMTPSGTEIELHPKGRGASADDLKLTYDETTLPALATLRGRSAQGNWILTVRDLAAADTGRLNRWSLEITTIVPPAGPVELQESPGTAIPDFPAAGIERGLATTSTARVASVEVSVDISHTYIGDLRVSLVSPAGTEALLHDGSGSSSDNLVRTFTAASAPALSALAGQAMNGTWRLRVADRAAQDVGKLNSWRLVIKPSA